MCRKLVLFPTSNHNTYYWGTCPFTALGTGLSLRPVND